MRTADLADREDREAARLELDRNVLVEAGAGTGKTTLLIDRIAALLLGGGLEIGRLVALTFTEKAAAEIKFRLARRLGALSALLDGRPCEDEAAARCLKDIRSRYPKQAAEYRARAQAAHRGLERAQIGTIHSFCSHILRLYPIEAGLDPDFRIDADGAAFDELFDLEWALWLDGELGERAPRPDLWERVLGEASIEDLRELAKGLAGPRARPDGGDPGSVRRELAALAALAGGLGDGKPKTRGKILDYLAWAGKRLSGDLHCVPPTKSPPAWPKDWPAEGLADYKRVCAVAERLDASVDELIGAAVRLVSGFSAGVREAYRRRGWVSFDGLLTGARDLVRDHPRARAELKSQYGAFLIDEFQDTDPLQGELLLYLAERPQDAAKDWRETKLEPGKLFVVGDAKQSIYRFRGADIAAVEGFFAHMAAQGARRCVLRTNFRSSRAIVAAANAVFSKAMAARPGLQPAYRAIEPAAGREEGEAPWRVRVLAPPGTRLSAAARRRAEAAWIADWIENRGEGIAYRDIALVVRTTTDLIAYLEPLKKAGIPYVVEAEKYFFGTQEVSDFLNLLRAIDDPADKIALAGLLRSPLAALEDREIYALARRGLLDYRKNVPELARFFELLRRFNRLAGRESLGALLRSILRDTFLLELCARAYHRQQTASNLMKFGRLADEAAEEGTTLKEFIADVARSKRERLDEGESPLADESYDAVRILTIHKAKGLEYPVVLLPNLSGGTRVSAPEDAVAVRYGDGAVGLRLGSAAGTARVLMDEEEKLRQRAEDVRVLYVAMTRPKTRLILLGGEAGEAGSFAAILEQADGFKTLDIPADVPDGGKRLGGAASEKARPLGKEEARAFAAAWKARAAAREALQGREIFLSPSAGEGRAGFCDREEDAPASSAPLLLGRLCHGVLERWDYAAGKGLGGETLAGLLAGLGARLKREEPDADMAAVQTEAGKILKSFLASRAAARLARCEIIAREAPLLYGEDGQAVRGVLDVLLREEGRLVVLDYKTEKLAPKERPARAKRYAEQGRRYARAVRAAYGEKDVSFEVVFLRCP